MILIQRSINEAPVEWHLGEPIPGGIDRIVRAQLDGDELNMLLRAMSCSYVSTSEGIYYTKQNGFRRSFTEGQKA